MKLITELNDERLAESFKRRAVYEDWAAELLDVIYDSLRAALGRFTAPIVCICGSTRFKQAWISENARLTGEGNIVLAVGLWGHHERVSPDEATKAKLDALHLRKIDLCDWVWVLDIGGYIGESTRNEIAYAEECGKPVWYLSQKFPDYVEPVDPMNAALARAEKAERGLDAAEQNVKILEAERNELGSRLCRATMALMNAEKWINASIRMEQPSFDMPPEPATRRDHEAAMVCAMIQDELALSSSSPCRHEEEEKITQSRLCLLRSEVDKAIHVLKIRMKSDGTPKDFIIDDLERVHYSDVTCPHEEEAKRLREALNISPDEVGRIMHNSWARTKEAQGFHHPEVAHPYNPHLHLSYRCDKCHDDLISWEMLPEGQKDINRHAFDDVMAELRRRAEGGGIDDDHRRPA